MQNKRGNVAVVAIIIAIVAITAGVISLMFAKNSQAPIKKEIATKPIAPVQQTQPNEQVGEIRKVLILAETANWQTYTDKQYGYEIKYPPGWKVVISTEKSLGGAVHDVGICEKANMANCMSIENFNKENAPGFMGEYSKASITIDGVRGTWLSTNNSNNIVFESESWEFHISNYFTDGVAEDKKIEQQKVFDNILSTFKFIK